MRPEAMLPTESLQAVVHEVAEQVAGGRTRLVDLLNLRLANHTFSSLATPKVFGTFLLFVA
jgi:hypothetical protein